MKKQYYQQQFEKCNPFQMPIWYIESILSSTNRCFDLHWHKELEIILVTSGEGTFTIHQKEYQIFTNDILLISPEQLHYGHVTSNVPMNCHVLIIDLELMKGSSLDDSYLQYIKPLQQQELSFFPVLHSVSNEHNNLQNTLQTIVQHIKKPQDTSSLRIKSLLFDFFAQIFSLDEYIIKDVLPLKCEHIYLKTVIEYMELHYTSSICIEYLATLAGYSTSHFLRSFKEHTGTTCISFLNSLRLSKACELLLQNDASILEISNIVGFENVSYFIRCFHKKYGISPNAFRKLYKSS